LETDKILKEKEALTKDGVVVELEATITDLQKQLEAYQLKSPQLLQLAAKKSPERIDYSLQQR
jgi:hypothetical protein